MSKNSAATKELRSAWNSNYESFGVQAFSLLPAFGDMVVSPKSAWCLEGVNNVRMSIFASNLVFPSGPFVWHTTESTASAFQRKVVSILENGR